MEDNTEPRLSWSAPGAVAPAPASSKPADTATPGPEHQIIHTQMPVYAGLLVGGIIVGALLAAGWSSYQQDAPGTVATTTEAVLNTVSTGSTLPAQPLSVQDQPAGSSVAIGSLSITRPVWVVVYVSREGRPGNALGARLFFAGDKQGSVKLLRNTEAGKQYFVGISVDNGDHTFSLTADKPLVDAGGGPLWATFRAM